MTSKYQNSSIAPIGINPTTEHLQEQTPQEINHNGDDNPVGVLDDATEPVPVVNFHPASVDDVESVILE